MQNIIIDKNNILLAYVVCFINFDGKVLYHQDIEEIEPIRKVVFYNNCFLDLLTGDIVEKFHTDEYGNVLKGVYSNTLYYKQCYRCEKVSDEDLCRAKEIILRFLHEKELVEQKKLIRVRKLLF